MPTPNDIIFGKRRGDWARDAVKAIIATSTPSGRFLMLKGGFFKFQTWAIPSFKELSPFPFESDEVRWMFDQIEAYVMKTTSRRQLAKLEKLYEKERRTMSHDARPNEDYDGTNPGIVVENRQGIVH